MTTFTAFNFKGAKRSMENKVSVSGDPMKFFYKRVEASNKEEALEFDIYLPRTRQVYQKIPWKVKGTTNGIAFLEIGEMQNPPVLPDGAAFLETELISQACSVKGGVVSIYEDDLKNLCDLTNQPLVNSKWGKSSTEEVVQCPYCAGSYYLDVVKAKTVRIVCPYCFLTKSEAQDEINKEWGVS